MHLRPLAAVSPDVVSGAQICARAGEGVVRGRWQVGQQGKQGVGLIVNVVDPVTHASRFFSTIRTIQGLHVVWPTAAIQGDEGREFNHKREQPSGHRGRRGSRDPGFGLRLVFGVCATKRGSRQLRTD